MRGRGSVRLFGRMMRSFRFDHLQTRKDYVLQTKATSLPVSTNLRLQFHSDIISPFDAARISVYPLLALVLD